MTSVPNFGRRVEKEANGFQSIAITQKKLGWCSNQFQELSWVWGFIIRQEVQRPHMSDCLCARRAPSRSRAKITLRSFTRLKMECDNPGVVLRPSESRENPDNRREVFAPDQIGTLRSSSFSSERDLNL